MVEHDENRQFLRHALATLAYRGGKVLRDCPANLGDFHAGGSTRTPGQILAHIGDLLEWALNLARGERAWREAAPGPWEDDVARFFENLKSLDEFLASDQPLAAPATGLFQGPIADALAHVGQIALLRRLADCPIRGENYFVAEIRRGVVGREQAAPRKEFN